MTHKILQEIFSGIWSIERSRAEAYFPLLNRILKGEASSDNKDYQKERENQKFAFLSQGIYEVSDAGYKHPPEDAPENSVAIMRITDAISKYDQYCGPSGMQTKANLLARADRNPNIKEVILIIDSPGGEGDAAALMYSTIKKMSKQVTAYIDDFCASAGYYIACACDRIVANKELSEVGSIGTYMTFVDYTKAYDQLGMRLIEVYADASKDKNKTYYDALKGDTRLAKEKINRYNEGFLEVVRTSRPGILKSEENVLTGKLYYAEDAIKYGLIDEISDFGQLVSGIFSKYEEESSLLNQSDMKISFKNTWKAISRALGYEETHQGEITETDVENLNKKLEEAYSNADDLSAEKQRLTQELDEAKTKHAEEIASLGAQVASQQKEIEDLKEKLAGKPAAGVAGAAAAGDPKTKDDVDWETIDNLPHNKAVDED